MSDFTSFKQCSKCKQELPSTTQHFPAKRLNCCRDCINTYARNLYRKHHPTETIPFLQEGLKQCSTCKQPFPATIEYFYKAKNIHSGLRAVCKSCYNTRMKVKYEHANIYQNGDIKICVHCNQSKPATLEYFHAKKTGQYGLTAICKDCKGTYDKQYAVKHPLAMIAKDSRRRAFKQGCGGNHTDRDIQKQYDRQKGKCYYCHKSVSKRYHVDHVIPLSRGGSNDPSNLVLTCPFCNISKGDKLPHEWFKGGRLL